MGWHRVVKAIKAHHYLYDQRTWREGKKVRTESRYLGPADGPALRSGGEPSNTTWALLSGFRAKPGPYTLAPARQALQPGRNPH
jgi:hypothetical protein